MTPCALSCFKLTCLLTVGPKLLPLLFMCLTSALAALSPCVLLITICLGWRPPTLTFASSVVCAIPTIPLPLPTNFILVPLPEFWLATLLITVAIAATTQSHIGSLFPGTSLSMSSLFRSLPLIPLPTMWKALWIFCRKRWAFPLVDSRLAPRLHLFPWPHALRTRATPMWPSIPPGSPRLGGHPRPVVHPRSTRPVKRARLVSQARARLVLRLLCARRP